MTEKTFNFTAIGIIDSGKHAPNKIQHFPKLQRKELDEVHNKQIIGCMHIKKASLGQEREDNRGSKHQSDGKWIIDISDYSI